MEQVLAQEGGGLGGGGDEGCEAPGLVRPPQVRQHGDRSGTHHGESDWYVGNIHQHGPLGIGGLHRLLLQLPGRLGGLSWLMIYTF